MGRDSMMMVSRINSGIKRSGLPIAYHCLLICIDLKWIVASHKLDENSGLLQ